MRKWEKRALIFGLILVFAAAVIFTVLMAKLNFDFARFAAAISDDPYTENTYEPGNNFKRMEIAGMDADVRLLLSEDGNCRVVCSEAYADSYDVQIQNDTLFIAPRQEEGRILRWFSVNLDTPGVTVYTPVACREIRVETASGDVRMREMNLSRLEIASASGDINLMEVQLSSAEMQTASGDIELTDSAVAEDIIVHTLSGDVDMENFDANLIQVSSASGDISAELKTGKEFSVETLSGDVRVPSDISENGIFRAETASGDIIVRVK